MFISKNLISLSPRIFSTLLFFSYLLFSPIEALCIYDEVAFDIEVKNGKISISFTPDYDQDKKPFTKLYVAALVGNNIYFIHKDQDNIDLEKFSAETEPKAFITKDDNMAEIPETEFIKEWNINLLNNIKLFAGTGSSLNDMLNQDSFVCFYDGEIPNLPQSSHKWTLMIYMVGSDLEEATASAKHKATNDIMQMIRGTAGLNPDTVNLVLTTGGSKRKGWDTVKRSWIHNGQYYNIEDMGNLNMGKSDTLSDFVLWAKDNFPAEHYALLMWDHGMGTKGFGEDINFLGTSEGNTLDFSKLSDAFNKIKAKIKNPFDIVLFDACLMGTIEVAQLVSKIAASMGGSANTIPGFGFDYDALLKGIETKKIDNGIDFGKNASDAYIFECTQNGKFKNSSSKITYSIFDLTALNGFNEEFTLLSNEFLNIMTETPHNCYEAISKGIIRTVTYPIGKIEGVLERGVSIPNPVDLVGFLENIGNSFSSLKDRTDKLIEIIMDKLVIHYEGNITNSEKEVGAKSGRVSIDLGKNNSHIKVNSVDNSNSFIMILPESYDKLNQAMSSYYAKRADDTDDFSYITNTCLGGNLSCAGRYPNLLYLSQDDEMLNVNILLCQINDKDANNAKDVLLFREIYSGESINIKKEYPVYQKDLCSYSLCIDDMCQLITVRDIGNNILTANAFVNGSSSILTFISNNSENSSFSDTETWQLSSVIKYLDDGTWGQEEDIVSGDTITPTVSRFINDVITKHSEHPLKLKDFNKLYLKKEHYVDSPAVIVSIFGYNFVTEYKPLCHNVDSCFSSANDLPYPAVFIEP